MLKKLVYAGTILNPDTFNAFKRFIVEFEIDFESQQDGHGPFPTFEDKLDDILSEIKKQILEKYSK